MPLRNPPQTRAWGPHRGEERSQSTLQSVVGIHVSQKSTSDAIVGDPCPQEIHFRRVPGAQYGGEERTQSAFQL